MPYLNMVTYPCKDSIQELNQQNLHEFGARVRPCLKTEPKELITSNSSLNKMLQAPLVNSGQGGQE